MSFWSDGKISNPIMGFMDTLIKGTTGGYREKGDYPQIFLKALVIAVDNVGGCLETPDGKLPSGVKDADVQQSAVRDNMQEIRYDVLKKGNGDVKLNYGPSNPPGSIKARILSNGLDEHVSDYDLRVYWPLFPGLVGTVTAGQVVYVVFEDEAFKHGLWVSMAPREYNPDLYKSVYSALVPNSVSKKDKSLMNRFGDAPGTVGTTNSPAYVGGVAPADKFEISRKFLDIPEEK